MSYKPDLKLLVKTQGKTPAGLTPAFMMATQSLAMMPEPSSAAVRLYSGCNFPRRYQAAPGWVGYNPGKRYLNLLPA